MCLAPSQRYRRGRSHQIRCQRPPESFLATIFGGFASSNCDQGVGSDHHHGPVAAIAHRLDEHDHFLLRGAHGATQGDKYVPSKQLKCQNMRGKDMRARKRALLEPYDHNASHWFVTHTEGQEP